MTASRKKYMSELLEDCEAALKDFEGYDHKCYEDNGKAVIIAALILADSLNGLRKSLLQTKNVRREE